MADRDLQNPELPPVDQNPVEQAADEIAEEISEVKQDFQEAYNELLSDSSGGNIQKFRQSAVEEVVDVYLVLGSGDEIQAWVPVEMVVERSMYNNTDTIKFTGVPVNRNTSPIFQGTSLLSEDGTTEKIKARAFGSSSPSADSDGGVTPGRVVNLEKLFEGEVAHVFNKGNGTWSIRCTNLMAFLTNKEVNVNFTEQATASTILSSMLGNAGLSGDDYLINLPGGNGVVNSILNAVGSVPLLADDFYNQLNLITAEYTNITLSKALDKIARKTNSVWWVTRNNQLYFGPPAGDALGPSDDSSVQRTEYIIESSAGKQTPPYRSVQVIGDGVVSRSGWEEADKVNSKALFGFAGVEDVPNENGVLEALVTEENETLFRGPSGDLFTREEGTGLVEPTFVFRSRQIKTLEQANRVAAKLSDELVNQTKGGSVTMVGRAYVKPHDKLQLPQRFGGGEFIVNKVEHRFNPTDGYVTMVECGGLTEKDKAFYRGTPASDKPPLPEEKKVAKDISQEETLGEIGEDRVLSRGPSGSIEVQLFNLES